MIYLKKALAGLLIILFFTLSVNAQHKARISGKIISSEKEIEHVKRFNDTYHNEAVVGKIGLINKKWADR